LKRWTIGIAFILLLAGGGYLVHRAKEKREAAEWQAHYEKTLAAYSKGLRLGASRAEVEKYLNARKVEFTWIYAVEQPSNSYDYIVLLRREPSQYWYCGYLDTNIAFEFDASHPDKAPSYMPGDRLKKIRLWQKLEDCL
jgi:hypothetical protein